jgi:hypothetical protein
MRPRRAVATLAVTCSGSSGTSEFAGAGAGGESSGSSSGAAATTISGVVVGPDDEPVPGVHLYLKGADGKSAGKVTETDAEGRFEIRAVPLTGRFTIQVWLSKRYRGIEDVPVEAGEKDVRIELERRD